jgi:hypothetical protein
MIKIVSLRSILGTCLIAAAICAPRFVAAQIDAGGVTGTVKDSTGAVMPGVRVTLTNQATGVSQKAISTSTGTYVYSDVAPGSYDLSASARGFKSYVDHGLTVNVQQTLTIDIPLVPGNVSEEVNVNASAPLLQTENGALGQTVDTEMVNDLPLDGRDWVSLAQIAAGVTTSYVSSPSTDAGGTGSAYFAVNGIDIWQNDIRLNGINNNIELYGGSKIGTNATITPPPDAIQQFRLQSGNFDAEFGHSTGGIINAVTKSGTNRIRGDVWDYLRNSAFDANSYFADQAGQPIAPYRRNQFGGTIGGPVVIPKLYNGRDRTFFFFSYQGMRSLEANSVYSPSSSELASVPTALEQSSNFTNLQDLIKDNTGTMTDAESRVFPIGTVMDPATTRTIQPANTMIGGATFNGIDPVTGIKNGTAAPITVRDPFYTGGSLMGPSNFVGDTQYLNQIPSNRLDLNAVALLHNYPLPTVPNAIINNYFTNPLLTYNEDQEDLRIDHSFSPRDTLFISGDYSHIEIDIQSFIPGLVVGNADGEAESYPAWATAIGYNHVFSPTLVNDFHVGYDHFIENVRSIYGNSFGIPAQFGIQGIQQTANNGGLPPIVINGLTEAGVPGFVPTLETIHALEFVENLTKVHAAHVFKMGYQLDLIAGDITQPADGRGGFDYNGEYTQPVNNNKGSTGIADMLITPIATPLNPIDSIVNPNTGMPYQEGGLASYAGSNIAATDDSRYYMGAYFQDDWKFLPTVTLNLGLRWDYYSPYEEVHGRQANFIQTGGNGNSGIYYIPNKTCNVPRSALFNATLVADNITIQCTSNNALGLAQKDNFAPRLGFNWRIKPTFVFRGGYGIAFGALANIGYGGTLGTNYPFIYNIDSPSTNTSSIPLLLSDGATTATMENVFPTVNLTDSTQAPVSGLDLYGRQYNYQTPYVQTFNLMFQYQFSAHDSIQTGYVGALGRHLDNYYGEHNSPSEILPTGTVVSTYLPFPGFAENSTYETTNGSSNYNAEQTTYQHLFSAGLSLISNYTYSKCMTDQKTQAKGTNSYRAPWLPGFGIQADNGLCGTDATNVVHVAGTYQLPVGRGRAFGGSMNRTLDTFVGGWSAQGIFTYQSGQPFTIACATAPTADFGCNADVYPGVSMYAGARTQAHWINPAAFHNPVHASPVTIGDTDYSLLGGGAQQARGPSFYNLDSSVFKNFTLTQNYSIQFRVESFNTLNHTQLAQPNTGDLNYSTSTQFGEITALRRPNRIMQFALKLFY